MFNYLVKAYQEWCDILHVTWEIQTLTLWIKRLNSKFLSIKYIPKPKMKNLYCNVCKNEIQDYQ